MPGFRQPDTGAREEETAQALTPSRWIGRHMALKLAAEPRRGVLNDLLVPRALLPCLQGDRLRPRLQVALEDLDLAAGRRRAERRSGCASVVEPERPVVEVGRSERTPEVRRPPAPCSETSWAGTPAIRTPASSNGPSARARARTTSLSISPACVMILHADAHAARRHQRLTANSSGTKYELDRLDAVRGGSQRQQVHQLHALAARRW